MGNEKKEDLTTKNLVDKLLETFGETDEKKDSAKQMSIDGLQETKEDGLAPGLEESLKNAEEFMDQMMRREESKGERQKKAAEEEEPLPLLKEQSPKKAPTKEKTPSKPGSAEEGIDLDALFADEKKEPQEEKTSKKAASEKQNKEKKQQTEEESASRPSKQPSETPKKEELAFFEEHSAEVEKVPEKSEKAEEKDPFEEEEEDFFSFEEADTRHIPFKKEIFEEKAETPEMPLEFDEEDKTEEEQLLLQEEAEVGKDDIPEMPDALIFESRKDVKTDSEESAENIELQKEEQKKTEAEQKEIDENEMRLKMIFDKGNDLKKEIGDERYKRLLNDIAGDAGAEEVEEEYESAAQNAGFFKKYRKAYGILNVRTLLSVLALVLVACLELGVFHFAAEGMMGTIIRNPVLKALMAMQISMLLAAIGCKEVGRGFRALGTGRAVPEVFLALTVLCTVIYEGAMIFCHSVYAEFYNLPLALMTLLAILFSRANLKRNIYTFKVVSSRKPKYAVTHRNEKDCGPEKETFSEYIPKSSGVFGVGKAPFIQGFCRRSAKEPHYKVTIGLLAVASLVAALLFFVLGYYLSLQKDNNLRLLSAFNMAMIAFLLTVPFSAFISYSLPFYKASKKAFDMDSAIVGEFSLEEYADATVITFDDKAVFPPQNVRVRSLKLYGDARIDHVLFGAASVFHRLGGPLEDVFAVATKESGFSEDVDILEIEDGGVEAAVKGARVYVGSADFMKQRGFLASVDPADASMEFSGKISIMYFAIGNDLSAKMYIEYKPDKEFEGIMESLYKSGMCIGIRTLDPNIDDRMMRRHVELSQYPVRVLRIDRQKDDEVVEELDSGVVSKKSVKHLLKALSFCKRVLQVLKTNTIIKVLGMLLGVAAAGFILFLVATGRIAGAFSLSPLWVTLYQLCVMLPVLLISLIFA